MVFEPYPHPFTPLLLRKTFKCASHVKDPINEKKLCMSIGARINA